MHVPLQEVKHPPPLTRVYKKCQGGTLANSMPLIPIGVASGKTHLPSSSKRT